MKFSNEAYLPSDEELEKLTLRGYRGANAAMAKCEGSGIGLYTLAKICSSQDIILQISTEKYSEQVEDYGIFHLTLTFTNCI